ncbi:MAG: DUF2934 domain-containing protein [Candidatus Auribacterota bacterium]
MVSKKNEMECIEKKAYELWEKDGRQPGRELDYWLDAEKALKLTAKPKAKAPSKKAAPAKKKA